MSTHWGDTQRSHPRAGLRRQAVVYRAALRQTLIAAAQYRANYAAWMFVSVLQAVVYMTVWRAVAEARGGEIGGYDAAAFAGYFLALMLVRDITTTWIAFEVPHLVQTGLLSPMLLRPAHPMVELWGRVAATRTQRISILIPVIVVLFVAYDAHVELRAGTLAAFLVVLPAAIVTRYLADALLASVSHWVVRIDGIRGLHGAVVLVLSGQMVPIAVMPGWLQSVAQALPFYWTLGFPVELLVGRAEPDRVLIAAGVLAGWAIVLWAAFRWSWAAGLRRYGAVSG